MRRIGLSSLVLFLAASVLAAEGPLVFPGKSWPHNPASELDLSLATLENLSALVRGQGCVVRHGFMAFTWGDQGKSGDIASAFKPVLSTLLLMAVQEGKVQSVDARVAEFRPELRELNGGKDAGITFKHLASQTSGYGLKERPGESYSYNDFAITLYYETLMERVFKLPPDEVLRRYLAEPLQFEDKATFFAFGPKDRPGRLALSVRDMARFGLLWLNKGNWQGKQLIRPGLVQTALTNIVRADLPLGSGEEAAMLPGQRSMGGSKNITPVGPGYYSFNWWLNGTNNSRKRLFPDAPADTFAASGHGGKRVIIIFPAFDLLVCWNDSAINDHDRSRGNSATKMNRAVKLIVDSVQDSR